MFFFLGLKPLLQVTTVKSYHEAIVFIVIAAEAIGTMESDKPRYTQESA